MSKVVGILNAVDTVIGPIFDATGRIHRIGVFLAKDAVGTVVLEVSGLDGGETPPVDQWVAQKLFQYDDATPVDNLVGSASAQYAWAECPGVCKARLRKSATAGAARAALTAQFTGSVGS